jgi:hypothetical protein
MLIMLNMTMRIGLMVITLLITSFPLLSQSESPKKTPADVMREIRLKVLSTPPSQMSRKPTPEYPHVDGIIMDWWLQDTILSVMASSAGDGSIYTTGNFGVFGGVKYDNVRNAAKSFVKLAEKYYSDATPTKEYPYPQSGHVRFYLICYDGVRMIDADAASLSSGKSDCWDLVAEAQKEISALRQIVQDQPKETR